MDDAGVVLLVSAYEHSIKAGVAVASRDPRLILETTSLGETALHLFVHGDSPEAVLSLLQLGAKPDSLCGFGESPLSLAASLGRTEVVRVLLNANAAIHVEGQQDPTLHKGVRSGNFEVVKLLLEAGAQVNKQDVFMESALHIAAEDGQADLIELLLLNGADGSLKTRFGHTALGFATEAGHEACVALLATKH